METETENVVSSVEPTTMSSQAYRAVVSQFFGYGLDAYNLTIILTLSTILADVFLPKTVSPLIGAIAVVTGFALSEVMRPIGSALFGNIADRVGRRNILLVTIIGTGVFSALTAILPNYATAGLAGFAGYVLLRLLVGLFFGGEYAGGNTIAVEWAPASKRGLVSGFILSSFVFGGALAAGVSYLFISHYGFANMVAYAWRYIFLTTLVPIPVALFVRWGLKESPQFEDTKKKNKTVKTPIAELFKPGVRGDFFQVMLLMTGLFLIAFGGYTDMLIMLKQTSTFGADGALKAILVYIIGLVGGFIGAPIFGQMTQNFGRRKVGVIWAVIALILSLPLYYVIYNAAIGDNLYLAGVLSFVLVFLTYSLWGSSPTYLAERFKTSYRASGVGFGFSSGLIIGGWFTFYTTWLHDLFKPIEGGNIWLSSGVLLTIAVLMVLVAFYIGPETAGKSLAD